jgi:hypothetical protein
LVGNSLKAHPFYIGVTEIRYDSKKKTMQVSCKLFMDDVQEAMYKTYQQKVDFTRGKKQYEKLLQKYILNHLQITVNNKGVPLIWRGYEVEEEAIWCYMEQEKLDDYQMVKVHNSLLFDYFENQMHFIHCYKNEERKSYKITNTEKTALFTF